MKNMSNPKARIVVVDSSLVGKALIYDKSIS